MFVTEWSQVSGLQLEGDVYLKIASQFLMAAPPKAGVRRNRLESVFSWHLESVFSFHMG